MKEVLHLNSLTHLRPLESLMRYEIFIFVGVVMILGALIKLSGIFEFSSDWFWFLAGVGLIVEGVIALSRQRKFEKKYKIIEKPEENKS